MVSSFEEVGEDRRRLHVHGYFIVNDNELEKAEDALRVAAGKWGSKGRQVKSRHEPPDEGWASYIGKGLWKASPSLRANFASPRLTDYKDRPLLASAEVNKLAKELFNDVRWRLLKHRAAVV